MKDSKALFLAILTLTTIAGCSSKQGYEWKSTHKPSVTEVEKSLTDNTAMVQPQGINSEEWPIIKIPDSFRPCCVFGTDLKIGVVNIPVPLYRVNKEIDIHELGQHHYNAGFFGGSTGSILMGKAESNGLIYTCRGGMVDVAHIRDNADLTLFIFFSILPHLRSGITLNLFDELGPRTITLSPVTGNLTQTESIDLAVALAGWAAYNLSILHEINQWYGHESIKGFPEEDSAYSPEDLYSNIIGIRIAQSLIQHHLIETDVLYNENFTLWLQSTLEWLGAVPKDSTKAYIKAVDQNWWDSNIRVPGKFLLRLRNYDFSSRQIPNLIPPLLTEQQWQNPLLQQCPVTTKAQPLYIDQNHLGFDLNQLVTISEVITDPESLARFPITHQRWPHDNTITQNQFDIIIKYSNQNDMILLKKNNHLPFTQPTTPLP